ncbi:ATP-dependent DNA helicase Q1-like [Actinia tenebrosa]|uniref:DNA 3'-5' helicase n=1 Tax=Actinia tenebrosa TaxID=6105 RepID=A0A6P8H7D0_ACTTE|nr:ATP-dependent DNA helicase Q1-like [Actinia tenebrosa]
MVFCRKKEHVKELFELFYQCLGPKGYYSPTGEEPEDDRTRLFAMYHKKTHKLVKSTIETEFRKENGTVRIVFCTIAFGMGVNVKGGNIVIHLGPSSGLDDYLQESGRVGRQKDINAHALLLKYKGCTRSRNISREMKDYVLNTSECRRVMLLKSFCSNPTANTLIPHSCCDVCAKKCRCLCTCKNEQCSCEKTCDVEAHQLDFEKQLLKLLCPQKVHTEKTSAQLHESTKLTSKQKAT